MSTPGNEEEFYMIKFTVIVPEGFDPEGDPSSYPVEILLDELEALGLELQSQLEDSINGMIQDAKLPNGTYVIERFEG